MKQFVWVILGCLVLLTKAQADEVSAHRHVGSLTELETSLRLSGYTETKAYSIKNGDSTHPWQVDANMRGIVWCLRDTSQHRNAKRCIYAMQTTLEASGNAIPKHRIEDALEFVPASGFNFLDEDAECSNKRHPNRSVLAIGRWRDRKPPRVGGYAYSIKQAWVLDPISKRFVEIAPKDTVCQITEDRYSGVRYFRTE